MINITVNDLLNTVPVLRELVNKPFKGSVAFKLARLIREFDRENSLFEEARTNLALKYCERDENGEPIILENGAIKLQEDKIDECNEEISNLLSAQLEIVAEKIPAFAFDDIEMTPSQILAIETIIDF
jgi:hypothetical protein